jgi:hypothetical protein
MEYSPKKRKKIAKYTQILTYGRWLITIFTKIPPVGKSCAKTTCRLCADLKPLERKTIWSPHFSYEQFCRKNSDEYYRYVDNSPFSCMEF